MKPRIYHKKTPVVFDLRGYLMRRRSIRTTFLIEGLTLGDHHQHHFDCHRQRNYTRTAFKLRARVYFAAVRFQKK